MRREILRLAGQHDVVLLPRAFIHLAGDIPAALLLSQLLYWSDRTSNAGGWIYKSHRQWWQELGLSRYCLEKATRTLLQIGVIQVKLKRANGSPTTHYRVIYKELRQRLSSLGDMSCGGKSTGRRRANGNADPSQMDLSDSDQTLTETTTEITTQTTAEEIQEILEGILEFQGREAAEKLRELMADYPGRDYRREFEEFVEYWSHRELENPWLALRRWLKRTHPLLPSAPSIRAILAQQP